MGSTKYLTRLSIELNGMRRSIMDIADAEDGVAGHLGWANYCRHFKSSAELAAIHAKQDPSTKGTGHRISSELKKTKR